MFLLSILSILSFFLYFFLSGMSLLPGGMGSSQVDSVILQHTGDLPPDPSLYDCVSLFEGKPYDREGARECLEDILRSGYFEAGDVKLIQEEEKQALIFLVKPKTLRLEELQLGSTGKMEMQARHWLQADPYNLQRGDVFDSSRLFATVRALELFFKHSGDFVLVAPDVDLNYTTGRADISLRIVHGPNIAPEDVPYRNQCGQLLQRLDLTKTADHVPLALTGTRIGWIRPLDCYSRQNFLSDVRRLEQSQLFKLVEHSVRAEKRDLYLSLSVEAPPMRVGNLAVVVYGLAKRQEPTLSLTPGLHYSRSLAGKSIAELERVYDEAGWIVEVLQEVRPLREDGEVAVVFHVIGIREGSRTLNGRKVEPRPFQVSRRIRVPS
jgi:outer membrane protein assembly factor BamA